MHDLLLASLPGHPSAPPGPFLLAWGLVASVYGLAVLTNYRGFAENLLRRTRESVAIRRRSSQVPLRSRMSLRQWQLLAVPFAVSGLIATVSGINSISHEGAGGTWMGTGAGPYRYAFVAAAVAGTAWSWLSRNGLFRPALRSGGSKLLLALVASAGTVALGVGLSVGPLALCFGGWAVGGLAAIAMMMGDRPGSPGGDDRGRQAHPN